MKENYLSYNDVVNYFGEEIIANRYKYIYDKMDAYIRARELQGILEIQEGTLHQAVMDYFVDIYRMEEFHKMDHADTTKVVAYEIYWILRRKPLRARADNCDNKLVFSNEGFVTTLLAHELLLKDESDPMSQEEEEYLLDFLRHLNYHLKYRVYDKQNLELMLYAYQTGRKVSL